MSVGSANGIAGSAAGSPLANQRRRSGARRAGGRRPPGQCSRPAEGRVGRRRGRAGHRRPSSRRARRRRPAPLAFSRREKGWQGFLRPACSGAERPCRRERQPARPERLGGHMHRRVPLLRRSSADAPRPSVLLRSSGTSPTTICPRNSRQQESFKRFFPHCRRPCLADSRLAPHNAPCPAAADSIR